MSKTLDIKRLPKKHVSVTGGSKDINTHIDVHDTQNDISSASSDKMKNSLHIHNDISSTNNNISSKSSLDTKKLKKVSSQDNATITNIDTIKKTTIQPAIDHSKAVEEKHSALRAIFMGTGHFAGSILNEFLTKEQYDIIEIITQPNKKIGRKKSSIHRTLAPNPVRDIAHTHNFALFQPFKIDEEAIAHIKKIKPDIIVVASYGKILPKEFLTIPKLGSINVHASLLPQLRGASPAQNALILGLKETGVTIMQMDEGLDTGAILAQERTPIEEHEKSDELLKRLSKIGAQLLIKTLPKIMSGEITPMSQDDTKATICQLIDREDGHIQWTQTTQEIYNRYRALYPWPGIFSHWEETTNQIIRIKLRAIVPYISTLTDEQKNLQPGTVFIGHDQLCIKTFDTAIIIEAVQPECKVVMPIYDFLNGHKTFEGAVLR